MFHCMFKAERATLVSLKVPSGMAFRTNISLKFPFSGKRVAPYLPCSPICFFCITIHWQFSPINPTYLYLTACWSSHTASTWACAPTGASPAPSTQGTSPTSTCGPARSRSGRWSTGRAATRRTSSTGTWYPTYPEHTERNSIRNVPTGLLSNYKCNKLTKKIVTFMCVF